MKELMVEMLATGIIKPSSLAWALPVVLIPKDGKPRFCVNYIKLKTVTCTDIYPLPPTHGILDSLAGFVIFSTINLNSA